MEKKKVLIIEDDLDLLEVEQSQLENAGYEIQTAQDADTANKILSKQPFDCILLDMNLKDSSGKDVILQAKKNYHKNKKTPIIIVSGNLNIELIREVREKISSILVKPFSANDLENKIKDVIKKNQIANPVKKIDNSKHVFIVDDDKNYIDDLCDLLVKEKFQVVSSTNSQEAMIKLQNQKFDIIILDLDIDHRNGEWIVNILRRDIGHINFKTPVIIVSGFLETGSPRLKDMVQETLEKPVSFFDLTSVIRREISNSEATSKIVKTI